MADPLKKRILIIDDEEAYAEILQINLDATGHYEVEVALNAAEGFDKLRGAHFDLVLLDILMPKIEGHEALAQIKQIANIPVVIMSGYLAPQQRDLVVRAGATNSFLKTSSFDEIHRTIKQALGTDVKKK